MSSIVSRREVLALAALPAAAAALTRMRSVFEAGRVPAGPEVADVVATYRAGPAELDLAGQVASTWAYDGLVPGRLLRARINDLVEVTVINDLPEATSIHWHGLAIINAMDGVPGVTQGDIVPGESFTYRFRVPDAGTYWFHPHHGLQLDRGLYAPLIVDADDEAIDVDAEHVIVLDDWLDGLGTTPDEELARIRQMATEMGSGGHDMADMAMSPLLGGDAGDAVYPHHLINGRPSADPWTLQPAPAAGDRIRLRFINASGDTAYRVALGGHRMTVTHTDGFPVEPVEVDAFLIGMGERYDVVVDIEAGAWPLIALAEGKDGRAAAIVRTRDAAAATPDLTASVAELDGVWLRYADLRAGETVQLAAGVALAEVRTKHVTLTGAMDAFDWAIDGRPYGSHSPIEVDEGEWLKLLIENTSSMWHPIHLHGHTPQLAPDRAGPRKDTVNVLPGQSVELLLHADNPGTWMFHCHNAYHLEAGMATVLAYRNT